LARERRRRIARWTAAVTMAYMHNGRRWRHGVPGCVPTRWGEAAVVDLTAWPGVAAAARWRKRRDGIEDGEAVSRASAGSGGGETTGVEDRRERQRRVREMGR
jgi:hypothetical protein